MYDYTATDDAIYYVMDTAASQAYLGVMSIADSSERRLLLNVNPNQTYNNIVRANVSAGPDCTPWLFVRALDGHSFITNVSLPSFTSSSVTYWHNADLAGCCGGVPLLAAPIPGFFASIGAVDVVQDFAFINYGGIPDLVYPKWLLSNIAIDHDGNAWTETRNGQEFIRFDARSHQIATVPLPVISTHTNRIYSAIDSSGTLWLAFYIPSGPGGPRVRLFKVDFY
jgi:hypothetical protein